MAKDPQADRIAGLENRSALRIVLFQI